MAEADLILAVETSSRIGSVALGNGDELLAETTFSAPLRHSAEIFPAIVGLLSRCGREPGQIGQVYISGGPGSFTGLRIATTLAKTMHLATGVQIVSVDTLDVVASNVVKLVDDDSNEVPQGASHEKVAAIVDAKRGQFFVAVYERSSADADQPPRASGWTKILPDCLLRPAQFVKEFAGGGKDIWLLGDGLLYYKDHFRADGVRFFDEHYWSPRAGRVYLLGRRMASRGEFADPLALAPNYLRGPDVRLRGSDKI